MDKIFNKLQILGAAAKYDVACTSSGVDDSASKNNGGIGNKVSCGICHSFAADGRCISLLKVLMTNICIYDCKYCVNRKSNDVQRAIFTPEELAELTIQFYKRNYIEGLFLSSGVIKNPDYTCELIIKTLSLLRNVYRFNGYIHAKAIPGADEKLLNAIGLLADRMSVNIEMPSQDSLKLLAPDKSKNAIFKPMGFVAQNISQNTKELAVYKKVPKFVPAGQSTQMIIGASPETDNHILHLTENLYKKYKLKRVFFSAYTPVSNDSLLPSLDTKPPLLREHRLYQADWLMRFYNFKADEILDDESPNFNPFLDPKCNWAVKHPEFFPVEINKASYEELLRVPGIGVKSALRVIAARKHSHLDFAALKKLGVVLKRAQYFLVCKGRKTDGLVIKEDNILQSLMSKKEFNMYRNFYTPKQLEFFDTVKLLGDSSWQALPNAK
ncbi:putative DNA modification/repair radical SAM protein [Endomicrobium proavitum]|uniref:Putative DNA modification/repair radical SAM protein n=1 Tax=Endomicrobium proavitum TaxID=1408281 RepID=A0A0G3WIP8_9BACT|nr:putative DNA modification/repair radical SAM protein [Endomicrobium proavitum]AKL98188.1 putative DNA modification/repair radical SAM protein [Endomicrobium proavitum]